MATAVGSIMVEVRPADNTDKLYISDKEYEWILDNFLHTQEVMVRETNRTKDHRLFLPAIRVMAECSPRAGVTVALRRGEYYQPDIDDRIEIYFLRVEGKSKSGQKRESKPRDIWVPKDLKDVLEEHCERRGIKHGDEMFRYSYSTLKDRVKALGKYMAQEFSNDSWDQLRPHDFRRYFANRMHRAGVSEEVALQLGGWANLKVYRDVYRESVQKIRVQNELAHNGLADAAVYDDLKPDWQLALEKIEEVGDEIEALKGQPMVLGPVGVKTGDPGLDISPDNYDTVTVDDTISQQSQVANKGLIRCRSCGHQSDTDTSDYKNNQLTSIRCPHCSSYSCIAVV